MLSLRNIIYAMSLIVVINCRTAYCGDDTNQYCMICKGWAWDYDDDECCDDNWCTKWDSKCFNCRKSSTGSGNLDNGEEVACAGCENGCFLGLNMPHTPDFTLNGVTITNTREKVYDVTPTSNE